MTIINVNSISGINSITAQGASGIEFYNSSGRVNGNISGSTTDILHLQGINSTVRAKIESTAVNSYPGLRLTNDARSYDLQIDGATDAFRVYDGTASQERLHIRSDGKISTGTNLNTTNTYEFSITGADGTGCLYAHGRNHYLSTRSTSHASLTLKKSNSDSDNIDYLQLRDSANAYLSGFSGAGNLKPAAGKGIDFSNNSHSGGMTSEILDDYEEGTWTPEVRDNFSAGNLGSQDLALGHYTKIGNKVDVWGRLSNINTNGMTPTYDFCMAGLPFTSTSNHTIVSGDVTTNFITFSGELGMRLEGARSSIRLHETASAGNNDYVTISQINSGTADLFMHITYFVD